MSSKILRLPFSAVRGMDLAKKALICMATDDTIKGVLIKGPPGTAKSVLVRSFSELIPFKELINVPSNISDDQLFGGLDFEIAINEGRKTVSSGLLDRANGNVVYVDNVNLMESKVLDSFLECIRSEGVILEREGVSSEYSLKTSIVATMDPLEKELPESVSDMFDMCITIFPEKKVQNRVDIINVDIEYKKDPISYQKEYLHKDEKLVEDILSARSLLPSVILCDKDIETIVNVCNELNVRGYRGDISTAKVAKTLAALNKRTVVTEDDIADALILCLSHRRKQYNKESEKEEIDIILESEPDDVIGEESSEHDLEDPVPLPKDEDDELDIPWSSVKKSCNTDSDIARYNHIYEKTKVALKKIDEIEMFRLHEIAGIKNKRDPLSRRSSGRYRGFRIPKGKTVDPAFDATIRAAAPYQTTRTSNGLSIKIEPQDIREKIRTRRNSCSFIFTVDVSGSLVEGRMMETVQNAIRSMLMEGYVKRDRAALITFRERDAGIAVPFTRSVELICDTLEQAPTGGSTPLAKAVILSKDYATNYLRKHPGEKCYVIFITDGSATLPAYPCADAMGELERICGSMKDPNIEYTVIDSSEIKYNERKDHAVKFSEFLEARYIDIFDLSKY